MREIRARSRRSSGVAAWAVVGTVSAAVRPAVAARTARLDGRALCLPAPAEFSVPAVPVPLPVPVSLPVLVWCTCAPSRGEPLKETSEESPISGKFLSVKGMHSNHEGAADRASAGRVRTRWTGGPRP